MRTYDDKASLLDILLAAETIAEFVKGMSQADFAAHKMASSAVQHQLLILGEAVKCLSPEFVRAHPSVDWSGAAETRDVLVHHYEEVRVDETWRIVNDDVPRLRDYVTPLIPEEPV